MEISNFEDLIQFAIKREEEAYEAYGKLSETVKTPGLKELLLELQKDEQNHKMLLQDMTKARIGSHEIENVIDLKISDYLVEEPSSTDMTFQDILIIAAKKEQKAVELYTYMGKQAKTQELKKVFEFLIEQEKSHKLKLESEYEKRVLEWD